MLCQFKDFKQTCFQSVDLLKNKIVFKLELDSNTSWDDQPADESDCGNDDSVLQPENIEATVKDEKGNIAKRPKRTKTPTKRYVKSEPDTNGESGKGQKRKKIDKPKTTVTKVKEYEENLKKCCAYYVS
jgi:hypothetical protein